METKLNCLRKLAQIVVVFSAVIWMNITPFCSDVAAAQRRIPDTPVLIVADDEDLNTARRSSHIARRIVATLQDGMSRTGFRVLGEEAIASDLRWRMRDRRPKPELFRLVKLMTKSGKAEHQVRVLLLYRTYVIIQSLPSVTRVRVRIECEIHDLISNRFIASLESASPVRMLPPRGVGCDESCVTAVGASAVVAAGRLGSLLVPKLSRYRGVSAGGGRTKSPGDGHTMQIPYTVTLRYFNRREALAIIGVMADEFPGYKTHNLISQDPAVRRYSYITTAKPHKMEEWLTILLGDMNLDPEKEVATSFRGNEITLEKIRPTPRRPAARDGKKFRK